MSSIVIQVFLAVFVFGGFILVFFIIIKNLFAPKKISTLKNYIKDGNYKNAVNVAKEIISKDRTNVEAHYYLGEAYFNQGKNELALIEFKTADRSGSFSNIEEKKLRERLGELYSKSENIDEALKEYILLIKKYPNDFLYLYKAGELFEKKEMDAQAIKFYLNSFKLNTNYAPALLNLGKIYFKAKNYSEASQFLERVVSKEPDNNEAYFYLGMIKKIENNYKPALKYFEKSIRDKGLKIRSLMERGLVFILQKKYDEAVIELDRALKNCENDDNIKLNIMYVLASCYELNRNITEAIALWEEIYSKNAKFRDVSEKLSNYQELRVDDRMKDFLTATDIDFIDMCKGIIFSMGLNITEQEILSNDSVEFLCLEADNKWRNMKKRPKLIQISRSNSPIDEGILRKLNDKMRDKGVIRGVIITSSVFSKLALAYVKERPIELIDKNGLQEILKSASI